MFLCSDFFANLVKNCKPIAVKCKKYSKLEFIAAEIKRPLAKGIIESSTSPRWAQVIGTPQWAKHKKRMMVNYSQTVNRFTILDAHPLSNIKELVNMVSQYKIHSAVDLKSIYHQVPIADKDKPNTALKQILSYTSSAGFHSE